VLHGLKVPEPPLFFPNLPVEDVREEAGCQELKAETAEQAVLALTAEGYLPHLARAAATPLTPHTPAPAAAPGAAAGYRRPTVADYVTAYRTGSTTPTEVAERITAFLKGEAKSSGWFVAADEDDLRAQAAESTARWKAGKPLSVLDGVPYAVKDVLDVAPYKTTCGTSFLADKRSPKEDAPYMRALRAMGACLVGKTSLHEIGLGITGLNLRTGTALNPYGYPSRFCGGSSSGSGAVLAAGLVPLAIGSDGGGSIRIPASFCGVVGLKPTNGRVSAQGAVEVDCTVATLGAMGASVEDVALLHAVLANFDAWYTPHSELLPTPRLPHPLPSYLPEPKDALAGGQAGVFWDWFEDADPSVVAACKEAVQVLQGAGVTLRDVHIPELELLRVAHSVTIVSEMHHNFQSTVDDPSARALFNPDVRLSLDVVKHWTTADYIQAQRIRARGDIHFRRALSEVDCLLVPTTGVTAPRIPYGALSGGCSDLGQVATVMKFTSQANMLGLPAISVPVGKDKEGLPIGFQLIGHPWCEGILLRYAAVIEGEVARRAAAAAAATVSNGGGADAAPPAAGVPVPGGEPSIWIDPLTGAKKA